MLIDVVEAKYVRDFIVWVKFEDGSEGEIDLTAELYGPVFEPLKDVSYFKQVRVDPELGTIAWPNGAILLPNFYTTKSTCMRSVESRLTTWVRCGATSHLPRQSARSSTPPSTTARTCRYGRWSRTATASLSSLR
jgi:Protein of unknown function (DUF2442)